MPRITRDQAIAFATSSTEGRPRSGRSYITRRGVSSETEVFANMEPRSSQSHTELAQQTGYKDIVDAGGIYAGTPKKPGIAVGGAALAVRGLYKDRDMDATADELRRLTAGHVPPIEVTIERRKDRL